MLLKWLNRLVPLLLLAEVALILVSWFINAAAPELPVRSLLSNEGIRWFFGSFVSNLLKPLLVWLVLCCLAYGSMHDSGLLDYVLQNLHSKSLPTYRQRLAIQFVLVELLVFAVVLILLTCIPHAVLLSVTGYLVPGIFAHSIIPIIAFMIVVCSFTYGIISGTLQNLSQICLALTSGFTSLGILFPLYVLGMELYESICFVF